MDVLDLLAREGLISDDALGPLRQRTGPRIAAPIDASLTAEDVVADLVAREAGTVVIDLDRGTLEPEAVHLLPAEIARRHLVVVVAVEPGGRTVRAAFANPLDEPAVAEVAAATGRAVRALVGTVSAIRRAIEREYQGPPTGPLATASGPPTELPPEATRKVASARGSRSPSEPAAAAEEVPRTLPVHRLEQEATIEQRCEALLLTLIEKGVLTRAEYGDALKRLLGKR